MNNNMTNVGLSERFMQESSLYTGMKIGRVSSQYKDLYKVITEDGERLAEISGKFRYEARSLTAYPAVGDFVMLVGGGQQTSERAIIHHVLSRKSVFERKAAGTVVSDIQVIAANMDIVFICMALNSDFNLRRLERYLSIAWDSGATPVIVLTKSDLCLDLQAKLDEVAEVAVGVDVLVTSGLSESGLSAIQQYVKQGITCVFIGSSGVGKSTLINLLLGEAAMDTGGIRNDDRGRHTTTHRELFLLPAGGIIIDTPGMRELGLESAALGKSFADIEALAASCKFSDCSHRAEPGCAVQRAIQEGTLSVSRLESYIKLQKEAKYEGLTSRQIETEKINTIFGGLDSMKKARRFMKNKR